VINGLIVFVEVELYRSEYAMHVGVVIVERKGGLQLFGDCSQIGVRVFRPAVQPSLTGDAGLPCVSVRIRRSEL
jgi:hypothetical protein